jgi:hypothetical protein
MPATQDVSTYCALGDGYVLANIKMYSVLETIHNFPLMIETCVNP